MSGGGEASPANAGFCASVEKEHRHRYPRLQILTVEDLLTGKLDQRPSSSVSFKRAPKASGKKATSLPLDFAPDDEQDWRRLPACIV